MTRRLSRASTVTSQPCPCGETLTRWFYLGWRCTGCAPTEAQIRTHAIDRAIARHHLQRQSRP